MKLLIITAFIGISSLAQAYVHDGLYKTLGEPYANHCESKFSNSGVSRSDEQILINHCLQDFVIQASRKIQKMYPEFAKVSGRDQNMTKSGAAEAQAGLREALHMYDDDIFRDPLTEEVSVGHKAAIRLQIELGRRLDQIKIMEDQPGLMNDEDEE
jgi:hypothetical protein